MLPRKRALHSSTHFSFSSHVGRSGMTFKGASRICVQVILVLLLSVSAINSTRAQGCASCNKSKAFVTIGFYAKACARYPYFILIENEIVATGSGNCTTTGWTSADRILVDLKPNVPYLFSVDAGETCSSHFNFYDVPEGYKLEINGVETTTIDKVSGRGYGGNGDWTVVVREACNDTDAPSGTPTGPDVGSVLWGVSMGNLSDGRSAGKLSIREPQLTATSYTPDALIYAPPAHTTEVDVTQNGSHRQVKAPESLADIVTISATEYDIRFYSSADVGSKDGSGLYTLTGTPYVTYTIKNPDPASTTRLQILKSQNGGPPEVDEYTWDPLVDLWTLSRNNGARIETKVVGYPTDTSRTETFTVRDGSLLVSKIVRTYHTYSFGEELLQEVTDPDGAALTTSYSYYEDSGDIRWHKIKSITYPDSSWVKYDYDSNGNVSLILRPWKDLSLASATEANARSTSYAYAASDGIETSVTPKFISSITEKIAGTVVGSTTFTRTGTTVNGNPAVVETERVYSSATNSQVTTSTRYHSTAIDTLAGRVISVDFPDGRRTSYLYEKGNYVSNPDPALNQFTVDANGLAERETTIKGTTALPDGIAFKTTKQTTIRNKNGNRVLDETYIYNGASYERVGWTAQLYDNRGHVTQTQRHTGQLSSAVWNADRQVSGIDESGTETTYTYDPLGRVRDTTKKGIAAGGGFPAQTDIVTTTTYDSDGHLITEAVSGVGVTNLTKSTTYDPSGRIKTLTSEAQLVTAYSYTNGGRTQTITYPGGAIEVIDKYVDGQTKSVTGTAVIAKYLDYGVNVDGTTYSQEFVGNAGLSSPRWTKRTADWMGRTISTEQPGFTGTNLLRTSVYNAAGQLQKEMTTANAVKLISDKLFEYDQLGQQIRTGLDINGDGLLTPASNDRLNETDRVYEKAGNDWFSVSSEKIYLIDNNAAPVVQTRRERLNNFVLSGSEQTVSEITVTDWTGNNTTSTTKIDRAAKKTTVTTDLPDSTLNSVSITVNGLLQSSSPATPQSATTYTYDGFGRLLTVTSPVTGVSARSYSSTTGQLSSITDGAATTSYEYYSEKDVNAGLLKSEVNSVTKRVYFKYNSRGDLLQTWGDTAYPIEYVYDSYGQKTELHTFRGGQNWTTSIWPANTGSVDVTKWIYQESTGRLTEKQDAAIKGATYTYDELGRTKTRTWERGITATYSYDPNTGQLSTIAYSDSTPAVTFTYDRGGRPATVTDAGGVHTRTVNVKGDLQTEQIAGGILDGVSLSVGYDSFLRRNSMQTLQGANTLSSQTYGYDGNSRLQTITSAGQTATYVYYPNSGLLNTTTFTGGTAISRSYDGFGRLQNITNAPAADVAQSYTYTYNSLNQRTRVTREDGSYWAYTFNDRGELDSGKKYWSDNSMVWGAQAEYKFDNIGNRTYTNSGGNQVAALRQATYTTNSLNQYSQRVVPGAVDISGTANSGATVTVNNAATARKADYFYKELTVDNSAAPQYPQINVVGARANFGAGGEDAVTQKGGHTLLPQTPETVTYDDDGNVSSDGRWNYAWDAENRLLSMESKATVPDTAKQRLEFAYDSMSRRIQKKVYIWNVPTSSYQLQSVKKFVYDGWLLCAELDGAGAVVRSYAWGQDVSGKVHAAGGVGALLLVTEGASTYQAGYDGNGNVTTLVNAGSNTIAAQFDYDAFGVTVRATGTYANNPFRFSTKYLDQETGLVYYGYRYYDPQSGRWINRDPSEESGGVNLYEMVTNNPITKFDPNGLVQADNKPKCCCCVENLDVITSGQFQGGFSISTYFPRLVKTQPFQFSPNRAEAGPFVTNVYVGAQVQFVSKVAGPGKKCSFSQNYWTEVFRVGAIHKNEKTNHDDFAEHPEHDQGNPPFRQYIEGNPSFADAPAAPLLSDSHVVYWLTTCLNSRGNQVAQECKSKQCCVKWKVDMSIDDNRKGTATVMKVGQWCN